jgi:hypothetical protein
MTDSENFLSRWSRRKREAASGRGGANVRAQPVPPKEREAAAKEGEGGPHDRSGDAVSPQSVAHRIPPPFDPADLPAVESITADTDIRGFLAAGVPPELARAALRRAWISDPKVRDFVGPADYAWDFNGAGSMDGFGPLEKINEGGRQLARLIGRAAGEGNAGLDGEAKLADDQRVARKTVIG